MKYLIYFNTGDPENQWINTKFINTGMLASNLTTWQPNQVAPENVSTNPTNGVYKCLMRNGFRLLEL